MPENEVHSVSAGPFPLVGQLMIKRAQVQEAWKVAEMIDALPSAIQRHDSLPPVAAQACLEIFLVHVRGMIEFLGAKRTGARDYWAGDMWTSWVAPTGHEQEVLVGFWQIASEQIMHFSKARSLQPDGTWYFFDENSPLIGEMADAVLTVWDRLADGLKDCEPLAVKPRSQFGTFFQRLQ